MQGIFIDAEALMRLKEAGVASASGKGGIE